MNFLFQLNHSNLFYGEFKAHLIQKGTKEYQLISLKNGSNLNN